MQFFVFQKKLMYTAWFSFSPLFNSYYLTFSFICIYWQWYFTLCEALPVIYPRQWFWHFLSYLVFFFRVTGQIKEIWVLLTHGRILLSQVMLMMGWQSLMGRAWSNQSLYQKESTWQTFLDVHRVRLVVSSWWSLPSSILTRLGFITIFSFLF